MLLCWLIDYYQAVKKPSRTCSGSLPYQEALKTGFCGVSEFLLLQRMKWCCRDGGLLGKVLNPPVIQTIPGSVVSLSMISLLSEEAGL